MCSCVKDSTNTSIFSEQQIHAGDYPPSSLLRVRDTSGKKNEAKKTCHLPFALNNSWVSPPYRRFAGNSITTREKASGLSWLEIDQVIQIPPWREAKRIGFKTGWERLRGDAACLLISFSLSEQKKQTVQPVISSTDTGQCTGQLISDPAAIRSSVSLQQTANLHTVQGWLLSKAASLTRIPGDTYNGHFNEL